MGTALPLLLALALGGSDFEAQEPSGTRGVAGPAAPATALALPSPAVRPVAGMLAPARLVGHEVAGMVPTASPGSQQANGTVATASSAAQEVAGTLVVLVRHAERAEDDPRDPNLSAAGHARARALVAMLADADFTAVWTTDYKRTRQTAAPLVEATGLTAQLYDPSGPGLAAFAERLRTTPGRHLVVGHSNTTPALVAALGGDPQGEIDELEYDRLYLLVIGADGEVTTTLLRFGAAFEAAGVEG